MGDDQHAHAKRQLSPPRTQWKYVFGNANGVLQPHHTRDKNLPKNAAKVAAQRLYVNAPTASNNRRPHPSHHTAPPPPPPSARRPHTATRSADVLAAAVNDSAPSPVAADAAAPADATATISDESTLAPHVSLARSTMSAADQLLSSSLSATSSRNYGDLLFLEGQLTAQKREAARRRELEWRAAKEAAENTFRPSLRRPSSRRQATVTANERRRQTAAGTPRAECGSVPRSTESSAQKSA